MLHNFAAEKEDRLAAAGLKAPPQPPVAAVLRLADPDVRRPGPAPAVPLFHQRPGAHRHPAGGCLALGSIASYALWTRRYMVDELNKDYIRLARVKGMPTKDIMVRHVLKNAFVPMIAYIPASVLLTTGGPLLVERFFSVPGMGPLLTDAIGRYDTSVVQALQNFMKKKSAAVMAFVFFAVVVFTFIATAIGKYQYTELRTRLMEKFTSPNSEYWFGTDNLGRD